MIKHIIIITPLIISSMLCGSIYLEANQLYEFLFSPSWEVLAFLLRFIIASIALVVGAGLIAILLRPGWLALCVFALSSAVMLLRWGIEPKNLLLIGVYAVGSWIYYCGAARELNRHINFSAWNIRANQTILLMVLMVVLCGCFYFGYNTHIEQNGFSVPPKLITLLVENVQKPILKQVNPEYHSLIKQQLNSQVYNQITELLSGEYSIYVQYIPLMLAFSLFMMLAILPPLISWIPSLVLNLLITTLTAMRLVRVVTETKEVQRLTI